MGKQATSVWGSRSREEHQENLRVCGAFPLTKEKRRFLAIFGRYHTLSTSFLAKGFSCLKTLSKPSSIKRVVCVVKRGTLGNFLKLFGAIFFWRILGRLFGQFSLKESLGNFRDPLGGFLLGSFEKKTFLGKVLELFERIFEKDLV